MSLDEELSHGGESHVLAIFYVYKHILRTKTSKYCEEISRVAIISNNSHGELMAGKKTFNRTLARVTKQYFYVSWTFHLAIYNRSRVLNATITLTFYIYKM